jgi:seryl-tRNA synthetase
MGMARAEVPFDDRTLLASAQEKIMHDIKAIRENPDAFDQGLRRRALAPRAESLIALDEKRRAAILALQTAQERRNAVSKQIGLAMARKDTVAADDYRVEVAGLKAAMSQYEDGVRRL